jgi:hypothetical protein
MAVEASVPAVEVITIMGDPPAVRTFRAFIVGRKE